MITSPTRALYKNMIMPDVYQAIENGTPMTAIGLSEDNIAVGALVGAITEGDVFEVRSLYVAGKYRRQGGGTMLIRALQSLLEKRGLPAVLSCLEGNDESDALISFMESIGAVRDTELEGIYRGRLRSFWGSGLFSRDYNNPDIKRFTQLSDTELEDVTKIISRFEVPIEGNFFQSGGILKKASLAAIQNGTVQGVMLYCSDGSSEPIILVFGIEDVTALAGLINTGLIVCEEVLGEDAYVRIPVWSERYHRLLENMDGMTNLQHNYIF